VASCIASQDDTRKGISPGVELLNVNVFLPDGAANLWDIKKGWDWVARWKINHPNKKVICCNSIGAHPYAVDCGGWISPSPLDRDANIMVLNYDIPMVVAAGNRATISTYLQVPLKINSPGQAQYVLTVGAVDDNLNLASFSCRGGTEDGQPKPDCVAPGVNIEMFSSDGSQYTASGTSFSTPLTAGVVALLAEEHQEHSATQIQDAIKDGARDLGTPDYDTDYGYGIVDAQVSLAVINGEKPEKTYTTIGVADIDIPLGTLPIIGIIGLVVLFYPEIRKRR
jgi:subtilisin family serine protease